uniref:Uncharacterized protein n=1 Tax=Rhizophora mucronata TaxID=61149 RepID=A0A2P2PZ99_RHIMU
MWNIPNMYKESSPGFPILFRMLWKPKNT